jgi:predicted permease
MIHHLRALAARFRGLFGDRRADRDLDDDIETHLRLLTERYVRQGMAEAEAARAARRQFGNVTLLKEDHREMRGIRLIDTLSQDLRFGARMLVKSPGFTFVAALTLALGIGASTAIFSVVEGVILSPLAYRDPDRLVMVWQRNPEGHRISLSLPDFEEWQRHDAGFQQIAGARWYPFNLTNPGTPEHIAGYQVSSGFFKLLGAQLYLGREFLPEEDRPAGPRVAIINDRLWKDRFSSSPQAIGKSITLDGVNYTIIGVLPPDFRFVGDIDVYIPLEQGDPMFNDRRFPGVLCIARLKAGVSIDQAQSQISALQHSLNDQFPATDKGLSTDVVPLKPLIIGDVEGMLLLIMGAVGIVMLITCANVASLLLARSTRRAQEFALRSALGASNGRLVRQLITESLPLVMAGGILGVAVAKFGLHLLLAMGIGNLPRSENIGLNGTVLLFMLIITILVGVLFGLAPAFKSLTFDLQGGLKQGSRGNTTAYQYAQKNLVVLQMALTMVLLVGAGLLFRTIRDLWAVNPGFDSQNVITFKVGLSPAATNTVAAGQVAYRQLMDRIRSIPGVQSAEATNLVPLDQLNNLAPFWIGSHASTPVAEAPRMLLYWTGQDYLRTMKIPLLQGRFLTPEDGANAEHVIVIDSVLASTYFPNTNPIGQTIYVNLWGEARIIGVAGQVKHAGLGDSAASNQPQAYASLQQVQANSARTFYRTLTVVVRALKPTGIMSAIKAAVYEMGSDQPVYEVRTMEEIVSNSMTSQRLPMTLLGVFAALALVLAAVGIYGVISYAMAQRVQEIGVRMALGAGKWAIFRMVLAQGLRLALTGIVIGALGALILTRAVSSFSSLLYGVGTGDPVTFVSVSFMLLGVSLLACYIPARRATKVDPLQALRHE